MKKMTTALIVAFSLTFLVSDFLHAESHDDLQVIKKAVKENPEYKQGKEVKWFKLLVRDNKRDKDTVKITLPISIVDVFIRCAENRRLRIDREDCDIDIGQLFRELKELGPMMFIELSGEEATVKVWLE